MADNWRSRLITQGVARSPNRAMLRRVGFGDGDFDKAIVKPEARTKLDDLVTRMKGVNLEVVIAVGHTDRIGSDAYNQKLSVRRAEAVKAYLVSKGIAANRVYTEGKGKRQPVKNCTGGMSKALIACLEPNRRVEVEVVGTRSK